VPHGSHIPFHLEEGQTGPSAQRPKQASGSAFQLPSDLPTRHSGPVPKETPPTEAGDSSGLFNCRPRPEPVWISKKHLHQIGSGSGH